MRLSWNKCFLGDVITLKRGYDLPAKDRVSGIYPVVSSSGVTGTHNQARAKGPGIVTGRYGTLGEVFYVSSDFWPLNTSLYISDFKGNDPRFAGYLLWSLGLKRNNAAGAVPGLNRNHLHRLEICFPPLPIQRRIASVLSAYDDLIENNRRRIAILEEMARRLYEEWFVHFRFPGHEHVPFIETEQGRIPERWEVKPVSDVLQIFGGGTPSKKQPEFWEGGMINWYTPTDLTREKTAFMDKSATQITKLGLNKSSAKLLPAMSVMMTSRATIGSIAINTTQACTNQGFITCLPSKEFPLYLLYHWLHANVETFISLGTGATFKEITKGTFRTVSVVVPSQSLAVNYQNMVEPIMKMALNLQRKNTNLRAQRDLLLPKLVSGEIDIRNAEKTWGEAA